MDEEMTPEQHLAAAADLERRSRQLSKLITAPVGVAGARGGGYRQSAPPPHIVAQRKERLEQLRLDAQRHRELGGQ